MSLHIQEKNPAIPSSPAQYDARRGKGGATVMFSANMIPALYFLFLEKSIQIRISQSQSLLILNAKANLIFLEKKLSLVLDCKTDSWDHIGLLIYVNVWLYTSS